MNDFGYAPANLLDSRALSAELAMHRRGPEGWNPAEADYMNLGWSRFEREANAGMSNGRFVKFDLNDQQREAELSQSYVDMDALTPAGQAHYLFDQAYGHEFDEEYRLNRLVEVQEVLAARYVREGLTADPEFRDDMAHQLKTLPMQDQLKLMAPHEEVNSAQRLRGDADMVDYLSGFQQNDQVQQESHGMELSR